MSITTEDVKNRLKELVPDVPWTMGKLDQTKIQTACVYGGRGVIPVIDRVGNGPHTYTRKAFRIVTRFTTDFAQADVFASGVHQTIAETKPFFSDKFGYTEMVQEEAVSLGTDEKGVYEHSIDFQLICER